jgi:queuine tRNA-ribosyltransferase subunit QTRTD1
LNIDACLLSAGDFFHMEKTIKKMQSETTISFKKYINQEDKTLYFASIDSYKMKCVEGT